MAMTLVSTVTVGAGGAASIEFTGIAGTGKDLLVLVNARAVNAAVANNLVVRFNSSTSSYDNRRLLGDGSSASSNSTSGGSGFFVSNSLPAASATASTFGNAAIYVSNYAGSTSKSVSADGVSENNATEAYQTLLAGLWGNSAAITTVTISSGANLAEFSSASLYIIS